MYTCGSWTSDHMQEAHIKRHKMSWWTSKGGTPLLLEKWPPNYFIQWTPPRELNPWPYGQKATVPTSLPTVNQKIKKKLLKVKVFYEFPITRKTNNTEIFFLKDTLYYERYCMFIFSKVPMHECNGLWICFFFLVTSSSSFYFFFKSLSGYNC